MMMSALYYTNKLSWIYIVLAHRNNSPWWDISLHSARTHYSDSDPIHLISCSLIMCI